jgi:predicted PurR-regulated permease PerM
MKIFLWSMLGAMVGLVVGVTLLTFVSNVISYMEEERKRAEVARKPDVPE